MSKRKNEKMIADKLEYVPYEELFEAYLDCLKRKKTTTNGCKFMMNAASNLYQLWKDLNCGKYEIGRSITFTVDKPVKREIFAADFRDRVVHHLVINRIGDLLENEFIEDSYSCRVGKGTEYGIQRCYRAVKECSENYTKDVWIFKGDLKSFFMTINKDILFNALAEMIVKSKKFNAIDEQYTIGLVRQIIYNEPQKNCIRKQPKRAWKGLPREKSLFNCDEKHGLPIGNLTSQLFANFYLSYFDHWMKNVMGFEYYGRYVDDFYIVCEDRGKILDAVEPIREKLKEREVTLHPKKIYFQHFSKGVPFIGAIIKPNRLYILKRTLGNAWDAFQNIDKILEENEGDMDAIEYCVSVVNAYLGFMSHRKSYKKRKKMLEWPSLNRLWKYAYIHESMTKICLYKEYCRHRRGQRNNKSNRDYEINLLRNELIKKLESENKL